MFGRTDKTVTRIEAERATDGARGPVRLGKRCGTCIHFRNDASYLEAAFAGLTSLSSAQSSTRADDGICVHHDRYLGARCTCPDFSPAR